MMCSIILVAAMWEPHSAEMHSLSSQHRAAIPQSHMCGISGRVDDVVYNRDECSRCRRQLNAEHSPAESGILEHLFLATTDRMSGCGATRCCHMRMCVFYTWQGFGHTCRRCQTQPATNSRSNSQPSPKLLTVENTRQPWSLQRTYATETQPHNAPWPTGQRGWGGRVGGKILVQANQADIWRRDPTTQCPIADGGGGEGGREERN